MQLKHAIWFIDEYKFLFFFSIYPAVISVSIIYMIFGWIALLSFIAAYSSIEVIAYFTSMKILNEYKKKHKKEILIYSINECKEIISKNSKEIEEMEKDLVTLT